jgi:hypothetical protein
MSVRVILNEKILAFVKFMASAKSNVILLGVLAVLAGFVINGSSVVSNIIKERQATAATNDLGTSLSDLIKEKVSNIINKTFNQTLSGINQQSTSSTVNQQKSMQSSSISGPNKSTNVNCTNGKCIITTCTENNCTTTIENSDNSAASGSALSNITTITIGEPFYKQNDKPSSQKAVVVNGINASEISFSGTGTANGINFRDTGKALIMPRVGGATYVQGNVVITANNSSEKASYSFKEIGHSSSPDGTIKSTGAAFFGSNATGKLAFLNNLVAIYHNQIDKAGNSVLTAWKWK